MKGKYKEYHYRQYEEPYRSTLSLINFIKKTIDVKKKYSVVDIGCGGGANIYWFSKHFPKWNFTGVDIDEELIRMAKIKNPNAIFMNIDFFQLTDKFDIVMAIQFIPSVPFDLKDFLEKCNDISSRYIIFTGLFSPGWIEQYTIAKDLKENWEGIYKIYSIERLKKICKDLGFSKVFMEKFELDIEIPKPSQPRFGTYTEKTADGRILQISGYMLMPWYNIIIKK